MCIRDSFHVVYRFSLKLIHFCWNFLRFLLLILWKCCNTKNYLNATKSMQLLEFLFCRFSADGDKVIISGLYADSPSEVAREIAYKIYLHPDKHQDYLLTEMLQSRYKLATLCDFPTYSHRYICSSYVYVWGRDTCVHAVCMHLLWCFNVCWNCIGKWKIYEL